MVICGPTATGKTALGVKLAKKFNGEIVSADSRQVYRGMDIGTGKDLPKNAKLKIPAFAKTSAGKQNSKLKIKSQKCQAGYYLFDGIPVWLLDTVEPGKVFNVADYCELAWKVIKDIWRRGRLPILVGGTGFYIKTLIDGIESLGIEPDWKLRRQLSKLTKEQLREKLEELAPQRWGKMNESDRKNPRRLIRAIEIAMSDKQQNSLYSKLHTLIPLFIGLRAPYKIIYQRIDRRVEERIKMGALEEVQKLLKKGYSWNLPSMSGMGYREFKDFFEKKSVLGEVAQRWKFNEHGYARRQMTWFKKDNRVHWFDITRCGFGREVENLVDTWYNLRSKLHKYRAIET